MKIWHHSADPCCSPGEKRVKENLSNTLFYISNFTQVSCYVVVLPVRWKYNCLHGLLSRYHLRMFQQLPLRMSENRTTEIRRSQGPSVCLKFLNVISERIQLHCAVESNLKSFGNEANILIIINLFFSTVGRHENSWVQVVMRWA